MSRPLLVRRVLAPVVIAIVLGGCGGASNPSAEKQAPTTRSSSSQTTTSQRPTRPPGPTGGRVPTGFNPESFTAVSDSDYWVVGSVPCRSGRCTLTLRTTNGRSSFASIPAPSLTGAGAAGVVPTLLGGLIHGPREELVLRRRRAVGLGRDRLRVRPSRAEVRRLLERDVRPGHRPVDVVLVHVVERARLRPAVTSTSRTAARSRSRNSVISGNPASLTNSLPGGIDMISNGGGIHVGDGSTIDNTRIDGNRVVVDDVSGQPTGFDAGMIVGASPLVMRNSTIDGNQVVANVAATDDNGPSGSALEFDGTATIENTRITDNSTTVTSAVGNAAADGAISAFAQGTPALISNMVISGNSVSAATTSGSATVQGADVVNNGLLELRNVRIVDNTGTASGPAGFVQGGGIWNGVLFNPPPVALTLANTVVMRNAISASPGLVPQGGGLFSECPVTVVVGPSQTVAPRVTSIRVNAVTPAPTGTTRAYEYDPCFRSVSA